MPELTPLPPPDRPVNPLPPPDDPIFREVFTQEFSRLIQEHPGVILDLNAVEAWAVITHLQLALRHPANHGALSRMVRGVVDQLTAYLSRPGSALATIIAAGWSETHDQIVPPRPIPTPDQSYSSLQGFVPIDDPASSIDPQRAHRHPTDAGVIDAIDPMIEHGRADRAMAMSTQNRDQYMLACGAVDALQSLRVQLVGLTLARPDDGPTMMDVQTNAPPVRPSDNVSRWPTNDDAGRN